MHNTIQADLSAKFANMSIVCAFMVVCIHVGGVFEKGSLGWWLAEFTRDGVARMAVPYFFLVSGFFLAGKFEGITFRGLFPVWGREVLKRIRTLLIPLAIWPILGMFWSAPFIIAANRLAGRPLPHAVPFLNGVFWPGFGILWFVKFLFILVLLTPLLIFFVRKCRWLWLIVTFGTYMSAYTFLDYWNPTGPLEWCMYQFSLEGITYFSAGLMLRNHASTILEALRGRRSWQILWLGIVVMCVAVFCKYMQVTYSENCGGDLNLRHFPVPFFMVGIFGLMPTKRFPDYLISAAFPVYLLHPLCILPIKCLLNKISFVSSTTQYLIVWGGAFASSVFVAGLMRKVTPRSAYILFGGR